MPVRSPGEPASGTIIGATRSSSGSCSPMTSVTVAVEVPIWLTRPGITALERQHCIQLLLDDAPAHQTITGHIEFL